MPVKLDYSAAFSSIHCSTKMQIWIVEDLKSRAQSLGIQIFKSWNLWNAIAGWFRMRRESTAWVAVFGRDTGSGVQTVTLRWQSRFCRKGRHRCRTESCWRRRGSWLQWITRAVSASKPFAWQRIWCSSANCYLPGPCSTTCVNISMNWTQPRCCSGPNR